LLSSIVRIVRTLLGGAATRGSLYLVAFIVAGILTIMVGRLDLASDDPLIRMIVDEMMKYQ